MFEKILVEQNPQWNGKAEDIGVKRDELGRIISYLKGKHVLVITGIRRCGKSYLLKQIKDYLLLKKKN